MPTIFIPDSYRAAVEAASGGKQTVLYDVNDNPSIMNIIPKFNIDDIYPALGSGVHPAFMVGGVEKSEFFVGTFLGELVNGLAVSLPNRPPTLTVYEGAKNACYNKGAGWHLMSNWEWAAIALLCLKNGFQPRGNTSLGRSNISLWETGIRVDKKKPGLNSGESKTLSGSGPVSWRHDNTFSGISDLVGNIYEWQSGFKLIDGNIYMPNDNDYNADEAMWSNQNVVFDASTGPNGITTQFSSGNPILSDIVSKYSETPTPAGGGDSRDFSFSQRNLGDGWKSIELSAGYEGLPLSTRQRMVLACLAPKLTSGNIAYDLAGGVFVRNYGERMMIRGGNSFPISGGGVSSGLACLAILNGRFGNFFNPGFRPAFIL